MAALSSSRQHSKVFLFYRRLDLRKHQRLTGEVEYWHTHLVFLKRIAGSRGYSDNVLAEVLWEEKMVGETLNTTSLAIFLFVLNSPDYSITSLSLRQMSHVLLSLLQVSMLDIWVQKIFICCAIF
ncbi:hypothetical protein EAE96_009360 [Botrytis aclada]|nr:hypothetical protein EAE96_009360 [Botrytis aclada]